MNYKIKNDIKNNMVVVSVTVEKRLSDKQKRIKVRASHVEEYLNKNYMPPKNYVLGTMLTLNQTVDNQYGDLCELDWKFELIRTTPKVKARNKTTTTPEE